tara:strand:+ start:222 stop:512 length:291 start_codon:yes stop_codon:yes gene_type:complete
METNNTIKKESEIPFYVIISKSSTAIREWNGEEFAWGGSSNLKKTERILNNRFAFPEGKPKRVEKFANRAEAYASKWGRGLEIACGRFDWRPLTER